MGIPKCSGFPILEGYCNVCMCIYIYIYSSTVLYHIMTYFTISYYAISHVGFDIELILRPYMQFPYYVSPEPQRIEPVMIGESTDSG